VSLTSDKYSWQISPIFLAYLSELTHRDRQRLKQPGTGVALPGYILRVTDEVQRKAPYNSWVARLRHRGRTVKNDETTPAAVKKRKMRGVWISFAGRIIAQILGAAATIVLGVLVLNQYQGRADTPVSASEAAPRPMRTTTAGNGTRSIAVLPLSNFSADAHDQYFADGMTEALIGELAHSENLRVISRTSTMRYRSETKSIPEIGRELDVDLIVEGSVVRSGDRVRVTAQLIDARTDEHLWASSYDRSSANVLDVQAGIGQAIADDLTRLIGRPMVSTAGSSR
jgi:TolB-like protein